MDNLDVIQQSELYNVRKGLFPVFDMPLKNKLFTTLKHYPKKAVTSDCLKVSEKPLLLHTAGVGCPVLCALARLSLYESAQSTSASSAAGKTLKGE